MTKGSLIIEIFLWLLIIIPGLIYSLWRMSSKYNACPKCKNDSMIPTDTPIGKQMLEKHQPEETSTK
jgi:hypothetical protein